MITKTDKDLYISNGEFGEITKITKNSITIKFDGEKVKNLNLNLDSVQFKHGYAATVFKSQGASVKDVYGFHSKFNTINNSYVKMTRQIEDLHYYTNRNATRDERILVQQLSKDLDRGSSLSYKIESDFEDRDKNLLTKTKSWLKDQLVNIGDKFHQNRTYYEFDKKNDEISYIREVKDLKGEVTLDMIMEKEYDYVNVREVGNITNELGYRRDGLIEQENYLYLKENWKEALARGDKEFGIKDSKGVKHQYPSTYINSIAAEKGINNILDIIDKNSEFAKEIEGARYRKNDRPVIEKQSQLNLMSPKERVEMQEYVTLEIEKNYLYLKENWKEAIDRGDKEFGVKDFKVAKHKYPSTYFDSIRRDENIKDFIDKDSQIGREIAKELQLNILKQIER